MTDHRIPLARPWLGDAERAALNEVLDSGILSRGDCLRRFEAAMADLTGMRGGVGVNSGTVGLQIAMEAFGIGHSDEVITPAFTFVGTVNAIVRAQARPVLVDVEPDTLNLDPKSIRDAITSRTRAILVVHLFGRPARMDDIMAVAREHELIVIEDACEAIGARQAGQTAGGMADAGVFGFYPNKPVAAGEGGLIVADDVDVLLRCRQLRNQGLDTDTGTRHDTLPGMSARLSELHAAIALAQLERLEQSLDIRQQLAGRYMAQMNGHERIELPPLPAAEDRIAWFTFPIRIRQAERSTRDLLIEQMARAGIQCGIYFEPVHQLPFHRDRHDGRPLPVSEDAGARNMALPLYPGLKETDIDRVCDTLKGLLEETI